MSAANVRLKLAWVFRSTRLFHGLQQSEMAKICGVTQGTISKIEAEKMMPDMVLYYTFIQKFGIKSKIRVNGGLELPEYELRQITLQGSKLAPLIDFDIKNHCCTIRTLRPLYNYLVNNHGETLRNNLKERSIKEELFYIVNHPAPTEVVDALMDITKSYKITSKELPSLDYIFDDSRHEIRSEEDQFLDYVNRESIFNFAYYNNNSYTAELKKGSISKLQLIKNSELFTDYCALLLFNYNKFKGKTSRLIEIKEEGKSKLWNVTYS